MTVRKAKCDQGTVLHGRGTAKEMQHWGFDPVAEREAQIALFAKGYDEGLDYLRANGFIKQTQ